jgi:hypothetical protein
VRAWALLGKSDPAPVFHWSSYCVACSLAAAPEPEPFRFEAPASSEPGPAPAPVASWTTADRLRAATPAAPFGTTPRPKPRGEPDPWTTRIVRVDLTAGPLWRPQQLDAALLTSVEIGAMRGFSGVFATGLLVDPRRTPVAALDAPIGGGALYRGRLARAPVFLSIGLTAGLLVHRAKTERGLHHAVDPDLRVPIRFAWTIAKLGVSVALEQGFSFRDRDYSRRGQVVWAKGAYRIGFTIGLHWDIVAGRARITLPRRRMRSV